MRVPGFDELVDKIRDLPARSPLLREDLLNDAFRLAREGPVEVFYMPSEELNPSARVVLVGITPGWTQMELAYRVVRRELSAGRSVVEARRQADVECSFAGVMRTNLIRMLNELELPRLLGIVNAEELFGARSDLMCATSALKHAVFVNGENFTGHSAVVERSAFFDEVLNGILVPLLRGHANALVIPLGDFVTRVLERLVVSGALDQERCLFRFPHPSGANGHKWKRFAEVKGELAAKAERFLAF